MKIAFMWKWGSGKTTLSSIFIKYLENKYPMSNKIVFDVDINSHLSEELWILPPEPLGVNFQNIANILEPNLTSIFPENNIPEVWTYPITDKSVLINPSNIEQYWLEKYYSKKWNTYFFQAGNYIDQQSWKHSCYHWMLNSYELLIHHIRDENSDFIIADTTAGSDNLWTSLYMAYDLCCFIVEPTQRSIQVYKDYIKTAWEKNIYVIVNKIRSESDMEFILKNINENQILTTFAFNKSVYREQEDAISGFINLEEANFQKIVDKLQGTNKDWNLYYKKISNLYKKEVNWWFSDFHWIDLDKLYLNKNKLWE